MRLLTICHLLITAQVFSQVKKRPLSLESKIEESRRIKNDPEYARIVEAQLKNDVQIPRDNFQPPGNYIIQDGATAPAFVVIKTGPRIKSRWKSNPRALDHNKEKFKVTCPEFAVNATFQPKDIVYLNWVPFYVWPQETKHTVSVYNFSYPNKKLVKTYKDAFSPYLNSSIDWEQPKLLLKHNDTSEHLLIAEDRKGLFTSFSHRDLLPSALITHQSKPITQIRLKTEGPYLGMLNCEFGYFNIMAVAGNEPPSVIDDVLNNATRHGRQMYNPTRGEYLRLREKFLGSKKTRNAK